MPELLAVRKLGWQAQVPLTTASDKLFYAARYGTGENSIIFVGNPYAESAVAPAEIGNDILGEDDYIFIRKMRDQASTENFLRNRTTCFEAQLLSRLPVLYESVCGLTNVPDGGIKVTASVQKDINKIVYQLQFADNAEFATTLRPRKIEDFELSAITLNGRKVSADSLKIPANGKITLEYRSKYFTFKKSDLMRFKFTDAGKRADFEIVLPENANTAEIRQAVRLKNVFDFLVKHHVLTGNNIVITQGNAAGGNAQIVIRIGRGDAASQVALSGNQWLITAPDAAAADLLVRKFSYVLDQRYEYIFPFHPRAWDCLHPDMLKYFDLDQARLPLVRCFENSSQRGE